MVEEFLYDENTGLLQIADEDLPIKNFDDNKELWYLRIQLCSIYNKNIEDHKQTLSIFKYLR